ELLEKQLVPRMFSGKGPNDQVRIWSAGCATGEEAYSIAMLLAEYAARITDPPKIQVFATDIDERAIAQARECRYPETIALDVSPARLRQFFGKDGDRYQITKRIREMVLFAPHNVLRDPPFSRLDLISCRNLLIYLNRDMQERVLEIFYHALRPDGFLFLGSSESAESLPNLFSTIDKKHRIYKKVMVVGVRPTFPSLTPARWPFNAPSPEQTNREPGTSVAQVHFQTLERI